MRHLERLAMLGLALALAAATLAFAETKTDETRKTLALTYPEGPTISIKMGGTWRLPEASGEAKVERKKGSTEIEIELDEMKPAAYFGGHLNTYVLWSVSPEGLAENLGEFVLQGNRSKLDVTTKLSTFALIVTAEPHFLVDSPSRFVVLENTRPVDRLGTPTSISEIQYRGFQGVYETDRESLVNLPEAKGEIRPHLQAARSSVELARLAGAETLAEEQWNAARQALAETESAARAGLDDRNLMLKSHEAIRLAVQAQKTAQETAFQKALAAERRSNSQRIEKLEEQVLQAATQAERAEAEARRRELALELERKARETALRDARQAAQRAANAEREAAEAEIEAKRAQSQAVLAQEEAEKARQERMEARQKMRAALAEVVAIRETARGLIVNLPDILFDFDRSTLRQEARETLSRVAGILLVSPQHLLSVEGHTDSVGDDEYNLKLSWERAQAVRSYLIQAGLSADLIRAEGFGESKPIASNDTPGGRQQNRRVEIVISELEGPQAEDLP